MKNSFSFILFLVILIAIQCCSENNDADNNSLTMPILLLPTDNEISGWLSLGAYEEATDYDSLYGIIDGGAQVFIDNGFVTGAFQEYTNPTASNGKISLRIYDQGNEANARMTYDKVATGIGIPWSGAGIEARIDESALASYTVEFWQRNFFIQVIIGEKSDEALNIAKFFSTHISKKIK